MDADDGAKLPLHAGHFSLNNETSEQCPIYNGIAKPYSR